MTDAKLYLPVLYGSVRKGARSLAVARFVHARGVLRPKTETRLVLPSELPFGNLVEREWEMELRPPAVDLFVQDMARADGFVIVTPEYNHGIPGTLKNLLDHLYEEWNHKPFALVGAGGQMAGARAVEALRQVVSGVEGISIPYAVNVHSVEKAFAEAGPVVDPEGHARRVDRLWEQLEWYAGALRAARESFPKPGP